MTRALALCMALWSLLPARAVLAQDGPGARDAARAATDWRSPQSWGRLRLGMGPAEVTRILGQPGRVTRYYAFTRWEYPDALGKRVNFDARGRLMAWGDRAR